MNRYGVRWRSTTPPRGIMLLVLATVLIMGGGCVDNEPEGRCPEATCGPYESRDAFFPLAVGNSWTFSDSVWTDSGVTVQGFTRSVHAYQADSSGETWWHFMLPPAPYFGPFMQRNDTVFQEISTSSGRFVNVLRYVPPLDPAADSVVFTSPIDDDVPTETVMRPLAGRYSTPAGEFTGCASYRTPSLDFGTVHTVICAGVGPVSHDLGTHRKMRLTSYSLIH